MNLKYLFYFFRDFLIDFLDNIIILLFIFNLLKIIIKKNLKY